MIEFLLKDIQQLPNCSGVYSIVNILNNHRYIGSSVNIKKRLMRHRSELRHGRHHNPYLAKAYNKYGEDKFKVQILEVCEKVQDTLFFLEQKYLDLKPEYNIATLANRPDRTGKKCSEQTKQLLREQRLGKKASEETRKKISLAGMYKTTKPLYVYDLNGTFINKFNGIRKAMEALNINENCCSIYCALGDYSKNSKSKYAYGYLWSRIKYDSMPPYKGKKGNRSVPVNQYSLDGKFIRTYSSKKEAARFFGYENGRFWIKDCIQGKREEAFGFKWRNTYDK